MPVYTYMFFYDDTYALSSMYTHTSDKHIHIHIAFKKTYEYKGVRIYSAILHISNTCTYT